MLGAGFLGSGGGGSPEQGKMLVDYALSIAEEVTLADPEEVPDEAMVAVVGGMGSPVAALEKGIFEAHTRAFEALERAVGCQFSYVIPLETGSGNSIGPMSVAAKKGIPVIDGDGAGRAIPQLEMTTYVIFGVPIVPFTLANEQDVSVVIYAEDAADLEQVARAVSTSFGMVAGFATHAMTGEVMRRAAVHHTLSQAEKVGATLRRAGREGTDPARELTAALGGYLLARGPIVEVRSETTAGFDFGSVLVKDEGGGRVRVDFKNESMIAWRGERPIAIVPDMICCLSKDGRPLTNVDMRAGLDVAFIGLPATDKWRAPQATRVFSGVLEKMGYGGRYVPIEELLTVEGGKLKVES
jgi:DUF917 family protein